MTSADLITLHPSGLFCEPGGFFIDPWQPVDRAVITHAHGDHALRGHARYLAAREGGTSIAHPHGGPFYIRLEPFSSIAIRDDPPRRAAARSKPPAS